MSILDNQNTVIKQAELAAQKSIVIKILQDNEYTCYVNVKNDKPCRVTLINLDPCCSNICPNMPIYFIEEGCYNRLLCEQEGSITLQEAIEEFDSDIIKYTENKTLRTKTFNLKSIKTGHDMNVTIIDLADDDDYGRGLSYIPIYIRLNRIQKMEP